MNKAEILEAMYHEYQTCEKCPALCEGRDSVVFGAGKITSPLMLIGGGPDAQDERWQHPFVQRAGEMLADALALGGLRYKLPTRSGPGEYDVYVTNAVLCRPFSMEQGKDGEYKKQRPPTPDEINNCKERLFREIYTVDPKLIVLMGASATSLVTHLSLKNAESNLFYLEVPGVTEGCILRYPALVTWSPHELLEGREHKKAGSEREKFDQTIEVAAEMLRAAMEYSKEVIECPTP